MWYPIPSKHEERAAPDLLDEGGVRGLYDKSDTLARGDTVTPTLATPREIVRTLIEPVLANGGSAEDVMALLESVTVDTMQTLAEIECWPVVATSAYHRSLSTGVAVRLERHARASYPSAME
jgi:hypothetical protein